MLRRRRRRTHVPMDELDRFHNEMKSKYNLDAFFSNHPDVDEYFRNKVHRPLLRVLKDLDERPNWLTLRRALRLFLKFETYLKESTVPVKTMDKGVFYMPSIRHFKRNIAIRKSKFVSGLETGGATSIASGIMSYYAATNPNPVNVGATIAVSSLSAFDLISAGRARAQNPIGYKIANKVKDQKDLERITFLVSDHYVRLMNKLKEVIDKMEDSDKAEGA